MPRLLDNQTNAIHPFLERELVRDALFDALASLPPEGRRRAWTGINHLRALFDRVGSPKFSKRTGATRDTAARQASSSWAWATWPYLTWLTFAG